MWFYRRSALRRIVSIEQVEEKEGTPGRHEYSNSAGPNMLPSRPPDVAEGSIRVEE